MNFSETYRRMNEPVGPSPDLIRKTLAPARRRRFPRRLIAIAVAAAVLLATPALAVRSEMGYYVLYQISPAVAQLFQPVRMSCTDSGVTMEVAAVRVEGDTAQAYITLSGGPVDAATDLFDSYSFHLPFDQSSHCERVAWDEAAGAVTFLCTVQTLDGSPIPVDSHAGNAGQSGSRLADQAALMGQNTLRPLCLNITKSLQQAGNAGHVVGACLQAVGQEIGHGLERRGASGAAHE